MVFLPKKDQQKTARPGMTWALTWGQMLRSSLRWPFNFGSLGQRCKRPPSGQRLGDEVGWPVSLYGVQVELMEVSWLVGWLVGWYGLGWLVGLPGSWESQSLCPLEGQPLLKWKAWGSRQRRGSWPDCHREVALQILFRSLVSASCFAVGAFGLFVFFLFCFSAFSGGLWMFLSLSSGVDPAAVRDMSGSCRQSSCSQTSLQEPERKQLTGRWFGLTSKD